MKEPSRNGRRSHGFCHPGPTRRRPSRKEAPVFSLTTTNRILFCASPCPRALCSVPYGRLEKAALLWTTAFRPNSATRLDAWARPYGLLLLSSLGFTTPGLLRTSFERSRTESRADLRYRPNEPSRVHSPCAMLDGTVQEPCGLGEEDLPQHRRRSRSRKLPPTKLCVTS
jgi:hypothetical protein